MATKTGISPRNVTIPKSKVVGFDALPEDMRRAWPGLVALDEKEAKDEAARAVDFADITAETITVGAITIPIPTPLADLIIRGHLQEKILKMLKDEKVQSVGQLSCAGYMLIATQWWVLDHQYEKDANGRNIIRKFIEQPGWQPPETELLNYLEDLNLGESLQDFHAAYRTATSFDNAEVRRKKVKAARETGKAQKIPVLRPYQSQSEMLN